jgi:hypothetical protein
MSLIPNQFEFLPPFVNGKTFQLVYSYDNLFDGNATPIPFGNSDVILKDAGGKYASLLLNAGTATAFSAVLNGIINVDDAGNLIYQTKYIDSDGGLKSRVTTPATINVTGAGTAYQLVSSGATETTGT